MKKSILLSLLCINIAVAQDSTAIYEILNFQNDLNAKFATEDESPLTSEDLESFNGLDFFDIDTSLIVEAKFIRTPFETPFIMKTTNDSEPVYVKYGEASFKLKGKVIILNIYQNQELLSQEEYRDYLFLPFTDLTNGESSYTEGRFIDLRIPKDDYIILDFNQSYNPYCAYNDRYSCPVPPSENHIDLKILAGVKKFKKYKDNK